MFLLPSDPVVVGHVSLSGHFPVVEHVTRDIPEPLSFLLSERYPAPVISAMLTLADESDRGWLSARSLADAWHAWVLWDPNRYAWGHRPGVFADAVERVTDIRPAVCDDCSTVTTEDETYAVDSDRMVCESCYEGYYSCDRCGDTMSSDYVTCVGDAVYCDYCRDRYLSFCEHCEEWYDPDYDDDHAHDCSCESPHMRFAFPANGAGTVREDERLTVELPAGTIDDEGRRRISRLVWQHMDGYADVDAVMDEVGAEWQTKRGNYTRRLSSALHKRGVKLPAETLSEVGNIARAHSSTSSAWHVELTRDLNQPADAFYHDDSCWWQSYSASRCALKSWGGIGMRTFADAETGYSYHDSPTGRAWIQPMDASLDPTHDAEHAHAYVIFNGYGDLSGYAAARIVAHLTGKTYRRITYTASVQYVNGDVGYLVADAETCAATDSIHISADEHFRADADNLNRRVA